VNGGSRDARFYSPDGEPGEDYVPGIGWDGMHVEYLRVYRLTRPSQE
jgi:hypothetical protein